MSKIGKQPIEIPEGITVKQDGDLLAFTGKLGSDSTKVLPGVNINLEEKQITLTAADSSKQSHANWGTTAAHIRNIILGITEGFKKELIIKGIGFKANMEGKDLVLNLGFSHPVNYKVPEGITVAVDKNVNIAISGINRQAVGQVAAEIRAYKKPEPYLGKGIRYSDEVVRRKVGKKVAGAGA